METLRAYAATRAFSLGQPQHVRLVDDGRRVLFLRAEPRSPSLALYELDLETGATRRLCGAAELIGGDEALSDEEKARRERTRSTLRGLTGFSIAPDGNLLLLPLGGRICLYRRDTGRHTILPIEGVIDPQLSPDGRRIAFVRDHDLYTVEIPSGEVTAQTRGGSELCSYGLAEFVAQEEMGRMYGYVFSPDGGALCYEEADSRGVEVLRIADPLRPDREPLRLRYPRAGRSNAEARLWLGAIDVPEQPEEVFWDRAAFPYLAAFAWPHGGPLCVYVQDRRQRHAQLFAWRDGRAAPLLEERDETSINLWRGMPRWLEDGSGFLWISDRSGEAQLELRDSSGALVRVLCSGAVEVAGCDATGAYVLATDDPTKLDLWHVPFSGDRQRRIPLADGERMVQVTGDRLIDTCASRAELRTTAVRRVADGALIATMESCAEPPAIVPEPRWSALSIGEHTFAVAVLRPRASSASKLPVLLSVYGGPHHLHVSGTREAYFREQWLADQGFAVVAIDNRGTPRRGRAWERAIAGDFSRVPLEDQSAVLEALLRREPDLDPERVGVFGWSFGGYMAALCAMKRPDLYKSAVAGAPVVDWHDYDTHYTERYLGLPSENPDGYHASSLLTHAASLRRPLLLIHGTADDNVYFFHSLKLSDALTRHGIAHELLPLAGATHMIADPELVVRVWEAIARHFKRTL